MYRRLVFSFNFALNLPIVQMLHILCIAVDRMKTRTNNQNMYTTTHVPTNYRTVWCYLNSKSHVHPFVSTYLFNACVSFRSCWMNHVEWKSKGYNKKWKFLPTVREITSRQLFSSHIRHHSLLIYWLQHNENQYQTNAKRVALNFSSIWLAGKKCIGMDSQ